jgi:hypothetical protein
MTIWQALRQFMLDVPNMLITFVTATVMYVVTSVLGFQPSWPETIWFGLCAAGAYYHWIGVHELLRDRAALVVWPEHDGVDLETVDNALRREKVRFMAKTSFGAAGFVMMWVPPRVAAETDLIQQVVIVLLICAVIALDVDAVLDRRSRRRQLVLIRQSIERRRVRRRQLEDAFRPLFEAVASQTSEEGRKLAHDINGKLSTLVGVIEILKGSPRLDADEQIMVSDMDGTIEEVCVQVAELHTLVRDLAQQAEVADRESRDGPSTAARPDGKTDQP